MGTVASWIRLDSHARTTDLNVGLAAEVADPLWFVGRQLQLGELKGDDGGTPIVIDVRASWSRFTRYRAEGTSSDGTVDPIDEQTGPIEALVEREAEFQQGDAFGAWAVRVRSGRDLARRLRVKGLGNVADALRDDPATTFAPPIAGPGDVVDADDERYRALLGPTVVDGVTRGRAIDGAKVLAAHNGAGLPAAVLAGAPDARRADVDQVLEDWLVSLRTNWGVATDARMQSRAWVDERLEYAFSVAAPPLPKTGAKIPDDDDEIVLRATGYDGSGLDWYSLDRVVPGDGVSLGATDPPASSTGSSFRSLLAVPLTFPGAPADRFWQFEDASISLGTAPAGTTDLVRLVATEFAVVYSPDWLLAPVDVPVGSVAMVDWVIVRDTFGVATLIGDRATQFGDGVGRQYQPAALGGSEDDFPMMVVLPSSLGPLRSTPRERVAFQRDEMANVAWAIEHVVEGRTGRGVALPWSLSELALTEPQVDTEFELVWRLATPVPSTWVPLVHGLTASRVDRTALVGALINARLFDSPDDAPRNSKSRLLANLDWVHDDEVTGSGCQVTVVDQLARSPDGTVYAWRGRETRPGRGGASSGLRYDEATPHAG